MKALEGDLGEFPLTDLIQLLDLSKKTGAVSIKGQRGSETLEGYIYFRNGKIVGAEIPGFVPLEAVYAFFTLPSGPFHFRDGVEIAEPTIAISNEMIIMEGIMRQETWSESDQETLSLWMVPRLVPNPASVTMEVNMEAEEWQILTMVNGKNSVSQIIQDSGLGESRTREIITQLLKSGLIEEQSL